MDNRAAAIKHEVVSSEDEELILVDEQDQEIGFLSKGACHDGDGILHRAFSVFVFDSTGRVLLQQRSEQKRLWGGYWANSCCSHPRRGESMAEASVRRLHQELHLNCELHFLYKFIYQASFGSEGAEHELCWVYKGVTDEAPVVNANEIADYRYVTPAELDAEIAAYPERFTPWLMLEWERVRETL
ncbi:MAG: isopentenyl-diphosphate Delta-isomerase [Pseudomonadota bacterium]